MRKSGLLGSSAMGSAAVLSLSLGCVAPAFAQDAAGIATASAAQGEAVSAVAAAAAVQGDAAADQGEQAITVTGSRIRRPNLQSTVPITSVGPTELTERGDISLGDALNQLPSLRTSFSQANSTAFIGTAGINRLDLRGQGSDRTLVLINGRRHVSAVPGQYIVDTNTIPADLLERVDIVTGGNSAVYGSDAIAGVVNFILRRDFEGIRLRGQGGISTYGDRSNYSAALVAGHNFFDGRLNATIALEYARADVLYAADRSYLGVVNGDGRGGLRGFITSEITTAPNRNFNGIPNTVFQNGGPGITFGNFSLGGYVLTTCPAPVVVGGVTTNQARINAVCTGRTNPTGVRIPYNYAFQPDGSLIRDDESRGLADNRVIGGGVLGGLSATGAEGAMLLPGLERYAANLYLRADLSPAVQPFLEATYVRVTATQTSGQPTFVNGGLLANVFSVNNPFLTPQTRDTLNLITGGAATFAINRFNIDIGTRAEDHLRQTYRLVAGVGGELSERGNLRYEVAFNYGRTTTFYETAKDGRPGNVNLARFNNATNAVLAPAGFAGTNFVVTANGTRAVCAINADAITTNDDANCFPFNPFGSFAPDPRAVAYVTTVSSREQWAEQINATAFISGDSAGFFELPGGPIGFVLGAEYRREDAFSDYDDESQASLTFLNSFATFAPEAVEVREGFAELRLPILRDMPFFHELSIEGAARYSDYSTGEGVWAYNLGGTWAPVRDLRFRAGYGRSVRAPNLSNLFATAGQTFANNFTDPCDQPASNNGNNTNNITSNPNRARNCAAAGIPTTITYTQSDGTVVTQPWSNTPGSGIAGINRGNPDLESEVGTSWTFGAVIQPRWIPGLSISVDYYRITIDNIIAALSGQAVVNQCYDDPVGLDNIYCNSIFRRSAPGTLGDFTFNGQTSRRLAGVAGDIILPNLGAGFFSQPFNFVSQKTSGIDADLNYRTNLTGNIVLNLRLLVSWVENREQFTSVSDPTNSTRILSSLGDPEWSGALSANLDFGEWDVGYNARYVGRQILLGFNYENFFGWDGRPAINPDARPFVYYDPVIYHGFRLNFEPAGRGWNDGRFRFYVGVDNVTNELPPLDLFGTENVSATGQSGAPYPVQGRFFYAGAEVRF
jgi:outer membrane receptor protein involved in Fe transport